MFPSVRHLIWCAIIAFIMAAVIAVAIEKAKSWFFCHLLTSLFTSGAFAIVCSLLWHSEPFTIAMFSVLVFLVCFFGAPLRKTMDNPPPRENEAKDMEDTAANTDLHQEAVKKESQ